LADIAQQWANVLSYDAVGTGTTSDSEAIQNCLDENDNVIFPAGYTFLCKNLRLKSNQTVMMYGATLEFGGTSPSTEDSIESQSGIFYAHGTSLAYLENIALLGGKIIGNRAVDNWDVDDTATGDDTIQASFVKNLTIRDMYISEAAQDGIEIKSCSHVTIENCNFENIADAAVEVRGNGSYLIQNNKFYMVRNAFMAKEHAEFNFSNPTNIIFKGNYCETFHSPILFHQTFNITIEDNKMFPVTTPDTLFDGADDACINTGSPSTFAETDEGNALKDISIINNLIDGFTGNKAIGIYRQTETADVKNTIIKGNKIRNCLAAMVIYGGVVISDNEFYNITGTSGNYCIVVNPFNSDPVIIDRNIFELVLGSAIKITSGDIVTISNNVSNGSWFAELNGTITQLNVVGNNIVATGSSGQGVYTNGLNNAVIENNIITAAVTPISTEGNNVIVRNNKITKTGADYYSSVRIKGQDNIVVGNFISHAGLNPAIEFLATSVGGCAQDNTVENTGAAACMRFYSNRTRIIGNRTKGGNQGIRVHSNECVVSSNITENATYQGLDIYSGATKNLVVGNISLDNGTNYADAGTDTVAANNITA
jgi:hypothetical protein